jgi:hypothetical protein
MDSDSTTSPAAKAFIERWSRAEASERANAQLFLSELCDLLEVPRPSNTHADGYTFEYPVKIPLGDGSLGDGRIDLYRRNAFVLEAKQYADSIPKSDSARVMEQAGVYLPVKKSGPLRGSGAWDDAMMKARGQAERYARSLPDGHATPPFLLVADIGHTLELYADFTQAGKAYLPYPDPRTFRIRLADLAEENVRDRLRQVWLDPLSLDPSKISAAVTREIADLLATLAASLERSGHQPKLVGEFLTRCLFCMFSEDVGLLPKDSFLHLLESLRERPEGFVPKLRQLFSEMQTGTEYSVILNQKLLRFNGGLFEEASVLALDAIQIEILIRAATADWKNVEPAIFGTLLERALDPNERHALGAHYTPRAYVERLILPTIVEPLRSTWESVRTAAVVHAQAGRMEEARKEIRAFHDQLCKTTILDPACGSGNFLYVALEHMKRLEGEVLDASADFGENLLLDLATHSVDPHQFLGIELNPRAASIAEMVLWIGYLQWHFRTRGQTLPEEPVLRRFHNIECRDAVLAWDGEPQPVLDEAGQPVTVWDRKSHKIDPVTGREVPDESQRTPLLSYPNPRHAEWPKADYIVGNPPFIGSKRMRECLGDAYVDAIQTAWPEVPQSTDFVMRWWHHAACLLKNEKIKRFGFITTNSFGQTYVKRAVESHLEGDRPISIVYAIPDHPWVDSTDGASVRISMTVAESGIKNGLLEQVATEEKGDTNGAAVTFNKSFGRITASLRTGVDLNTAVELLSNADLCAVGMKTIGRAFQVDHQIALGLGLGHVRNINLYIRPYLNGRDLLQERRGIYIIDFYGLTAEEVMSRFPAAYQHLLVNAKPERDQNRNQQFAKTWWVIGHPRQIFRNFTNGLSRYIATVETSTHRIFTFLDISTTPDSTLVTFGFNDAFQLGVLSSRIHVVYALAAGGRMGMGNDPRYNKSRCFDPFPFPECGDSLKARIRSLAEELDAHRKRVQAEHPTLTLTGIYNVLEALREGHTLTAKEKVIHDQGLVSVLRQLHDDLDAAVANAYGWPADLSDEEILTRLVALNAERAAEEAQGIIRYLRPEYQNPAGTSATQSGLKLTKEKTAKTKTAKTSSAKAPWPKPLAERVRAVEEALRAASAPVTAETLAKTFARASSSDIQEILDTLVTLGRIHQSGETYSS